MPMAADAELQSARQVKFRLGINPSLRSSWLISAAVAAVGVAVVVAAELVLAAEELGFGASPRLRTVAFRWE